ncbi:MAG: hypothetical protein QG641_3027 [Candidatus Poribacteria bacterium]|nr:hypothetical protein [Euryarchaeota archaeon]MDQ1329735.1 hypothetical protein [Candidatus Poribacteria bacterium]MDQ1353051.1 hypothetical protein [Acidobacteriota bacterium]
MSGSIQDFISERENLLFDMSAKIEAYEKTVKSDKSVVESFKPRRIMEYRQKLEAEYNPRLESNEKNFVESLRRSHENIERQFDADVKLDPVDEAREPSRFQGRELRESNLLRKLDFLPSADDFIMEYNRALKSNDLQALSVYESLRNGIIKRYENENDGEPARRIRRLIDETRDGRISPDAVAQKEALSTIAFDWKNLNSTFQTNGLSGLKARKERKEMQAAH